MNMNTDADISEDRILQTFNDCGALLEGHFLLRSGLHSDRFFQAALLLQNPRIAEQLCRQLVEQVRELPVEKVISPAIGGLIVGQEIARALGVQAVFAEKNDVGGLELRRGFSISPGENLLVAEDVITRGGRVQQTIDLVRSFNANPVAAAVLVDRSGGEAEFDIPLKSLVKLQMATYDPCECPMCQQGLPLEKPGSGK
ncbi:MAG: orotate phosphoribosyltransferase [Lentisphaeria bacterium]